MPYEPPLNAAELTVLEEWWRSCGDAPVDEPGRARQLLAEVVDAQRRVARAEAETAEALAALVAVYRGPGTGDDLTDSEALLAAVEEVGEEVAPAMCWTQGAATERVSQAVRLVADLPATLSALACGYLDLPRARVVVERTLLLSTHDAGTVDAELFGPDGTAADMTRGKLLVEVDRQVHAIDATAVIRRSRQATAERSVMLTPLPDGQARLCATGPATVLRERYDALTVDALAVKRDPDSVDPYADPLVDGEDDQRGLDAIRFDLLTGATTNTSSGTGTSPNAGTTVLVALPTLLGADEEPAELSGYGPVPAWLARLAATDSRLRRVLVDPFTGQLTAIDGHTYSAGWLTTAATTTAGGRESVLARTTNGPQADHAPPPLLGPPPPPADAEPLPCVPVRLTDCPVHASGGGPYEIPTHVARFVRARTPRCTAPGCRVPAARCDLDHVVRHPDGPTCPCNLTPLCRRHHRMKHRQKAWRRWRVHRCEDGHLHWTSPLGHEHVVVPEPLLRPPGAQREVEPLEPLRYPPDATTGPSARGPVWEPVPEPEGPESSGWAGMDPAAPPF